MQGTEGRKLPPPWLLAAAAAALALLFGAERGRGAETAPVVVSVSFQVSSPYRISYEELAGLVALRAGDRLAREAIRESIRGLSGKSLFREVAAYVREEDGKADVLFYLRPSPPVAEVEVRGARKVGLAQVLAASRIRRGVPIEDRDLEGAEEAIRDLLMRKGFADPGVSVVALCLVETGAGKVVIDVREGDPGTVRSVTFPGASRLPPGRIAAVVGVEAGDSFDFRRWEEGVKALRREYKRAGYLTVRIAEPEVACEEGPGVCPKAAVEEGPRYAVSWSGNRRFSTRKLEEVSGLTGDEEVTEGALVHDVRERLLAFYREKEHLQAEVAVEAGEAGEEPRPFRIAVTEGPRGYIREILFEGNASLPSPRLRKQMMSAPRGVGSLLTGSGDFRDETWNEDMAAIIGLYQKEGFARARIAAVETSWDGRGGMTKTVRIDEGPRYRLAGMVFRGNDHFLKPELLAHTGNREGQILDYAGIDRDRDAVAEFYRNAGYLDVRVEVVVDLDDGKGEAVARFDVAEGPRYRLGNVVVRGNLLTDPVVVLREVTIPKGDPAGEDRLIRFQQAVYRTGLYRTVRVQRVKRPQEGLVDLVVEVEETLFFRVEFGAGYGTDTGIRGFVGAETLNLDGRGRRLGARVQASEKEQLYLARLREPWVLGNRWKWEGVLTASYSVTEEESFSLRKKSALAGISKDIFRRSSVAFQYEFSEEITFDVAPGAVLSAEDVGALNIAALRALFVLDLRDDPFNPRRGSFNSASAELAGRFLGGEVDYVKGAVQSSWYLPVFRGNTFVASARVGYAVPFGDTAEIPIQKRFFLGGRTTVRGFEESRVGPLAADGAPIGGDTMVNANAELRVPLRYGFLVAAFLDAGSVWIREDPRFGFDLREGAGLGLRYVTPIGPVAFDYGWKLDRRSEESPSEWHFTIGAVF